MTVRHFLSLRDLSAEELTHVLKRGIALKQMLKQGRHYTPFVGKTLGMIFEKSSTRTRVSFEVGMAQFGGHALFLSPRDTQLGRGEPIEDTARVLSRMVDIVMIRTFAHDNVATFARHACVPVINGLTDLHHPCQLLADLMTYMEMRGDIRGKTVAYVGDGANNMAHSWIEAASIMGFSLHIATPASHAPNAAVLEAAGAAVRLMEKVSDAVRHADLVVTDVWTSMGQEDEALGRRAIFSPYQVNAALMAEAASTAVFMHCLPAHRGEEVTEEVIDGPQSVVWDEAENRLHAQKALMEFLLLGPQ